MEHTVLVTGGSGFVGSDIIVQLPAAGHNVRTTVRSLERESVVRALLRKAGADDRSLTFFAADLTRDAGWVEAAPGCDYVMHVASPIPAATPKDENELIEPARDGTLRVLTAARDAGVRRVVMTSSCGAIYYGHPLPHATFDEASWTNIDGGDMSSYVKSKAIAERAAWDFIAREGRTLELAVVNPAGIFGPILDRDTSSSIGLVERLLNGMPGCPQLFFGIVDVRDVADLHLRAMVDPAAAGQRFIAVSGDEVISMFDIANVLRQQLGPRARRVPTRQIPNWVVRLVARFNPEMRTLLPLLGKKRHATSAKAQRLLGWRPRSWDEAAVASGESLLAFGVVR